MTYAEKIEYLNRMWVPGSGLSQEGRLMPDREFVQRVLDIYVPSEKLLVRSNTQTPVSGVMLSGPLHLRYSCFIGDTAEELYDELLKKLDIKKPKGIEVTSAFLEWAKQLNAAANPPKEAFDIL